MLEQLQRVGRVVALAVQRVIDFGANRGFVCGERHEFRLVTCGAEGFE
jgi:hypothetical protein